MEVVTGFGKCSYFRWELVLRQLWLKWKEEKNVRLLDRCLYFLSRIPWEVIK